VVLVPEHELKPTLFDRVSLSRMEHRLKLIQAKCRGWPVAVAVPGETAPATDPPAGAIHGGEHEQQH
jgi:hypothetical protein